MGVLSNVFEQAGLVTVGISLVRGQAESARPPRSLHCEFPLGRPLGRPGDVEFQTDVVRRALALLERTDAPVLVDHPEVIEDEVDDPAACPLPPRHDPDVHPAVDEARGIRNAYARNLEATGRTIVGRVVDPDRVPDSIVELIERVVRIEQGESLADVGLADGALIAAGQDLRAYYEEAGRELAPVTGAVTGARRLEAWFYGTTETGRLLRRARDVMKERGTGDDLSIQYVVPLTYA